MSSKKPNPLSAKLAAAVASAPKLPSAPVPTTAPAVVSSLPSAPPAATPSNPVATAKPLKVSKSYALNQAEIDKIEDSIDYLRSRNIRDVSKASVVRAYLRNSEIGDWLVTETASDKD